MKRRLADWKKFKELSPAFIVLPLAVVFNFFWGRHPSADIWRIIYWVLPRFFGYTLFLCLPLYLVKSIYSSILEGRQGFVRVDSSRPFEIRWFTHRLFRPFQGIGISFLFATRLLSVIHTFSGPALDSSIPFTPGELNAQRFFVAMTITILISLGLSVLWTFDDLGIRYHDRKDHELKMIGKYVGTIIPLAFGLYGIFNLHIQHAHQLGESPFLHVFRIVLTLYPPMVVFSVVHNYFIKKRAKHFSDWISLPKGGIWQESKKAGQD